MVAAEQWRGAPAQSSGAAARPMCSSRRWRLTLQRDSMPCRTKINSREGEASSCTHLHWPPVGRRARRRPVTVWLRTLHPCLSAHAPSHPPCHPSLRPLSQLTFMSLRWRYSSMMALDFFSSSLLRRAQPSGDSPGEGSFRPLEQRKTYHRFISSSLPSKQGLKP